MFTRHRHSPCDEWLDPGMQRHGIGRRLLAHWAELPRAQGSGALHVVGNLHAEDFYIACGFKLIGTTETRFGTGLLVRMDDLSVLRRTYRPFCRVYPS